MEDGNNNNSVYDDENGTNTTEYVEYDAGSGPTQHYIDSTIVYDVDVLLGDGSTITVPGTVIQLQNGDVFITDYGNLGNFDNLAIQSLTLSNPDSDFTGFWANSSVDNSMVVCFAEETLIDTEKGVKRVCELKIGDLVLTHDNGLQPVRWITSRLHTLPGKHAPISISPGSLAKGIPKSRLCISPQHRVLIASPVAERMFGCREVLIAAKALVGRTGIQQEPYHQVVSYWHFACENHELVLANGTWVETLFLGPMGREAIPKEQRQELFDLFGQHSCKTLLARPSPTMHQQRQLVRRVAKNRPLRSFFEAVGCASS